MEKKDERSDQTEGASRANLGTGKSNKVYEGTDELSAKSVITMGQSVGVELTEDVAKALGVLAMEKLRSLTLLAIEFCEHENSAGLRVSDFQKAENIFNSPSYGHGCPISSRKMVPIMSAKVVVMEEGPEINLLKTISSERISEMAIEPLDPTCFRHYANYDNDLTQNEDILGSSNYSCLNSSQDRNFSGENFDIHEEDSSSPYFANKSRINLRQDDLSEKYKTDDDEKFKDDEVEVLKTVGRLRAEGYCLKEDKLISSNQNLENVFEIDNLKLRPVKISAKWQAYVKVLTEYFLSSSMDNESEVNFGSHTERIKQKARNARCFFAIVTDIQQNGALPCLNVICDFLCDYLRGQLLPVTPKGLKLAAAIIDAFVCCPVKLNNLQIRKISSLLIEIVIYPAPYEVLNYLRNVFMKCLAINDDLLTWTCSYITEVLKQLTNCTYESLSTDLRLVFCGAICLANGLESVSIQVAQEFGWHTSIISFLEIRSKDLQLKSLAVLEEGGFVEEEILRFCRNFILRYHNLVTAAELKTIRDFLTDIYGEKLLVLLSPTDTLSSSRRNTVSAKVPCAEETLAAIQPRDTESAVIRRGYWKNRKVTLRYRKDNQVKSVLSHNNSS